MVLKNKKTVFVSGGTGKIGQYLVKLLSKNNFSVRVLTRKNFNPWEGDDNITLLEGDLLEEQSIKKGITGCHYIFHLAVYQNTNDIDREKFYQVNVKATENLLLAGLNEGVEKIINVSSIVVFKSTGKTQRDESWELCQQTDLDHYASTKLESLYKTRNLIASYPSPPPVITVFPTAVIDQSHTKSDDSSDLSTIQRFVWEKVGGGAPGGVINLIGQGDRILNYVSMGDLVDGLLLAAKYGKSGEEYILGGENITARNYLKTLMKKRKETVFPFRIPVFPFKIIFLFKSIFKLPPIISIIARNIPGDCFFSTEKAKNELGYNPKETL